jgi:hypothetical protein
LSDEKERGKSIMSVNNENQLSVQNEPVSEEELNTATGGIRPISAAMKIKKPVGTVVAAPRPTIWTGVKASTTGGSIR